MLDQIVRDKSILLRLQVGALGGVLEDFVDDLRARGHADRTIRDYVREAGHLARWMDDEGHRVETLSESTVEEFLALRGRSERGVVRPDAQRHPAQAALRRLVATLRARKVVAPRTPPAPSAVDTLVQQFLEHSALCRGVGPATCQQQGRYVREFLAGRVSDAGEIDLASITTQDLMGFVATRAGCGQTAAAKRAASALRVFLRFLVLHGLCGAHLADAVPTLVHRAPRLPRHLSREQVGHLLASFDRSDPVGRRDHAMTLCMVRLGLRVGEVVGLRLDDIAWREGTLRVAVSKSRRAAALPLPADVGQAIADYIRAGRAPTHDRHIFLTHRVPAGRQLDASAARAVVRRAFVRSALQVSSKGTHTLRHTVATAMVCEGASLKEIADVLRHRSLDTTTVYARVDLPALSAVAMPWPEVRP